MQLLKFCLSGKTAHFKKPDVNSYAYFTYSHIPKVALMGILGAIAGFGGYSQQKEDDIYPEFYEKLQNLKLAIVPPRETRGYFSKKIHVFNNSVGYASAEEGGNLIIREQWLEDISWEIYLMLDELEQETVELLKQKILSGEAVYIPYLGKNDHFADITDVCLVDCEKIDSTAQIDSLFFIKDIYLDEDEFDDEYPYLFKDYMPIELRPDINMYKYEEIGYTNREVLHVIGDAELFKANGKFITFI